MDRDVAIAVPLPGGLDHAAVFRGDPGGWLPGARPHGPRTWRITLTAIGVERPVLCAVSHPLETRSGVSRSVSWEPETTDGDVVRGDRWLPGFVGRLRLIGAPEEASLLLAGRVKVPWGALGAAIDSLGLGAVASRSLDELLRRTAAAVTAAAVSPAGHATRADSRPG